MVLTTQLKMVTSITNVVHRVKILFFIFIEMKRIAKGLGVADINFTNILVEV